MSVERREHERKNLRTEDVPGQFTIDTDNEVLVFSEVNDVSVSGMGVRLSQALEEGQAVVTKYLSTDFQIALPATVAWCHERDDGDYDVGVSFSSDNMNENVLFFMTLREYLDDYDEGL